jgi:hypothetical protein
VSLNTVERNRDYASLSNSVGPDRRGRPPVVGEPLYPDGRQHQVDLECRGGNRRGVVALEHFWAISLPRAHPHRDIARSDGQLS